MEDENFSRNTKAAKIESEETNNNNNNNNNNRQKEESSINESIKPISEPEMGITEFMTPNLPAWLACTLKGRYSDFQVHEIMLDKTICHLTDLESVPPEEEEFVRLQAAQAAGPPELAPEVMAERRSELVGLVGEEAITQLSLIADQTDNINTNNNKNNNHNNNNNNNNNNNEDNEDNENNENTDDNKSEKERKSSLDEITLPPVSSKSDRARIHALLRILWPRRLVSVTEASAVRVYGVHAAPTSLRDRERRAGQRQLRSTLPDHLAFTLFKENKDTLAVLKQVAGLVRGGSANVGRLFGFAGTKDKRGVTSQRVTVSHVSATRMKGANKLNGIKVGNFAYVNRALRLGDLAGNHFSLVLRDVCATSNSSSVDDQRPLIEQSVQALQKNGFLNYFGLQRFGKGGSTPAVGRLVLRKEWKAVVLEIFSPSPDDTPDLQTAKNAARNNDWATAVRILAQSPKTKRSIYFTLADAMLRQPHGQASFYEAFSKLPRTLRMFYVHAYQSLVWNSMASTRLTLQRSAPLPGDLVLMNAETGQAELDFDEDLDADTMENIETKDVNLNIKVLTEEDIQSGKYSLKDVVLPLPGTDSILPKNEIGQNEYLKSDGFDLESFRFGQKELNQKGTYRKLICIPGQVSWEVLAYEHPDEDLISSDFQELQKQPVVPANKGDKVALKLLFTLPSSCYATMAIRELTRMTTLQTAFL